MKLDLDGKIPMILDGGPVGIGIESTIIDLTEDTPMILRPGYITKEMLEEVLGEEVKIDPGIIASDFAHKAESTWNEIQTLCTESRSCACRWRGRERCEKD